jgi:hypothetical protein
MVKVPVVYIIDMTFVFDRGVTAGRTVLMAVVRMWLRVFHNQESNPQKDIRSRPIPGSDRRAKGLHNGLARKNHAKAEAGNPIAG